MANEQARRRSILYGAVVVGNQSIYATLKGTKPIVGGVTANPADPTAKNAYFLNGSQTSVLGPFATFTKRLPAEGEDGDDRLSEPAGRRHAPPSRSRQGMKKVGLKTTLIATPQNATDLLGPATQASSADMIVPALGFTDCVPFARALDQIHYTKPVLSTPLCTFIPAVAYAGGDLPQWIYGIAQTIRQLRSGPAGQALPQEGPASTGRRSADMTQRLRRDRLGGAARDGEGHERDPVQQADVRDDRAGLKSFPGPLIAGGSGHRLRQGLAGRAGRVRQRDPVLQLHRQGHLEARVRVAEASRAK